MASQLLVTTITYNTSRAHFQTFADSFERAAAIATTPERAIGLMIVDNGGPSVWLGGRPPDVRLTGHGNVGFARAANMALRHMVTTPGIGAVVLANPDGAFHPQCLARLFDAHERFPDDVLEGRQFPEEHPKHYDPVTGITGWASGACMLIPRATALLVGGFDERFFMYMEDVDLSWRVRIAGRQVRLIHNAMYMHDVVGRPESRRGVWMHLMSQRILGAKWSNPTYQARAEAEMIRHGFFDAVDQMPDLTPPVDPAVGAHGIVDFISPHLHTARW